MKYLLLLVLPLLVSFNYKGEEGKVVKVFPDGLSVQFTYGIKKFKFKDLPKEVQEKYNYSPKKAKRYIKSKNKQQAKARERNILWEENKEALEEEKVVAKVKLIKRLKDGTYMCVISQKTNVTITYKKKVKVGQEFAGNTTRAKYRIKTFTKNIDKYSSSEKAAIKGLKRSKLGWKKDMTLYPIGEEQYEEYQVYTNQRHVRLQTIKVYTVNPNEYIKYININK